MLSGLREIYSIRKMRAVHFSEMSVSVTLHSKISQRKAIMIRFVFNIVAYLWVILGLHLFSFFMTVLQLLACYGYTESNASKIVSVAL